jgi:hypothetical protein
LFIDPVHLMSVFPPFFLAERIVEVCEALAIFDLLCPCPTPNLFTETGPATAELFLVDDFLDCLDAAEAADFASFFLATFSLADFLLSALELEGRGAPVELGFAEVLGCPPAFPPLLRWPPAALDVFGSDVLGDPFGIFTLNSEAFVVLTLNSEPFDFLGLDLEPLGFFVLDAIDVLTLNAEPLDFLTFDAEGLGVFTVDVELFVLLKLTEESFVVVLTLNPEPFGLFKLVPEPFGFSTVDPASFGLLKLVSAVECSGFFTVDSASFGLL